MPSTVIREVDKTDAKSCSGPQTARKTEMERFSSVQGVVVIIIVSIFIFLIMRLLPGDPVLLYLDRAAIVNVDPEMLEKLRAEFGLDKPLVVQYFRWVNDILHGDLNVNISKDGFSIIKQSSQSPRTWAYYPS
jgi:ABC-type dipeptide/oligopeptide/nickel transport system permease component